MRREQCSAPGCVSPVEVVVTGVDYDGTPFVERTCGSCGIYLVEGGGEMVAATDSPQPAAAPPP